MLIFQEDKKFGLEFFTNISQNLEECRHVAYAQWMFVEWRNQYKFVSEQLASINVINVISYLKPRKQ